MNGFSTFIAVAADSKAPPERSFHQRRQAHCRGNRVRADLADQYKLTQEDGQFTVHVECYGIAPKDSKARWAKLWDQFFSKPMACLRASPPAKTDDWGLHFDEKESVAPAGVETGLYERLAHEKSLRHTRGRAASRQLK